MNHGDSWVGTFKLALRQGLHLPWIRFPGLRYNPGLENPGLEIRALIIVTN